MFAVVAVYSALSLFGVIFLSFTVGVADFSSSLNVFDYTERFVLI